MERLELLRILSFGQRVAEEEIDILGSYFVETDLWRRVYSGDVDVVYGPKGSGKSAIYSLLVARSSELFDRNIILAPAENPRGTPVFRDLIIDPPASEREFEVLWKLYFATILHAVFLDYGIKCDEGQQLEAILAGEGLVPSKATLQSLLKGAWDYVRWMARPQSIEAGVEVDGSGPLFFKGKISFTQPSIEQAKTGVLSVDQLLQLANSVLSKSSDFIVWILLDRLDVAFADNHILEQNALRALFHVYLDMLGLSNIKLKIFLRTDIWNRLSAGGFREASHIARSMDIEWNRSSLLNLVIRRALYNADLIAFYSANSAEILSSTTEQESFFYKMCPDQVDIGPNKPKTFDWILGRTRDGFGKNAPREIIHLLNCLKTVQIKRIELGEALITNGRLFERSSFKLALPEVSA